LAYKLDNKLRKQDEYTNKIKGREIKSNHNSITCRMRCKSFFHHPETLQT